MVATPLNSCLLNKRILIVEDETLVAIETEALVKELGCEVTASVSSVEEALRTVSADRPDAVLLDIRLADGVCYPLAHRLRAEHIPFAFATGLPSQGIPKEFSDVMILIKPCLLERLRDVLVQLLTP